MCAADLPGWSRMIGKPGSQHDSSAIRAVKECELLGQHVSGFQIRHQQDVGLARHRRGDLLGAGRLILMALSNASGPSSSAPLIWPRSAILHRAAASRVERSFSVTVSTADRMATFGLAIPRTSARSIAFWQMSRFAFRSGAILIAASVIIRGRG